MIQITPQMRVVVAVEPADFRKGIDGLARVCQEALEKEDYATLKAVVESYAYLAELVGDRNTTIRRLRKLLFGARTEKTSTAVDGNKDRAGPAGGSSSM